MLDILPQKIKCSYEDIFNKTAFKIKDILNVILKKEIFSRKFNEDSIISKYKHWNKSTAVTKWV